MYERMYERMYVRMYVCMYVHKYIHVYKEIQIYMCIYVYMRFGTCISRPWLAWLPGSRVPLIAMASAWQGLAGKEVVSTNLALCQAIIRLFVQIGGPSGGCLFNTSPAIWSLY